MHAFERSHPDRKSGFHLYQTGTSRLLNFQMGTPVLGEFYYLGISLADPNGPSYIVVQIITFRYDIAAVSCPLGHAQAPAVRPPMTRTFAHQSRRTAPP